MTDTPIIEPGWYIVELYGHGRVAGWMERLPDGPFYRITVPGEEHPRHYGGNAIYGFQQCTEAVAKHAAEHNTSTAAQRFAESLAWREQRAITGADPTPQHPTGSPPPWFVVPDEYDPDQLQGFDDGAPDDDDLDDEDLEIGDDDL